MPGGALHIESGYQSGHGQGCSASECTEIRDIVFRNLTFDRSGKSCYFLDLCAFACSISYVPARMVWSARENVHRRSGSLAFRLEGVDPRDTQIANDPATCAWRILSPDISRLSGPVPAAYCPAGPDEDKPGMRWADRGDVRLQPLQRLRLFGVRQGSSSSSSS